MKLAVKSPTSRFTESEAESASAGYLLAPTSGFTLESTLRLVEADAAHVTDPRDRWLVNSAEEWRRYPVMRGTTLLHDFERLAGHPSEAAIHSFADAWGWLGHPQWIVEMGPSPRRLRSGEAVSYWRAQAAAFRELRATWRAVSAVQHPESHGPQSVRSARRYLAERVRWAGRGEIRYSAGVSQFGDVPMDRLIKPADDRLAPDLVDRFRDGDVVEPARFLVLREINAQLQGHVSPAVPAFVKKPVLRQFPDCMLAAIYLRFALETVGPSARQRPCDHCGQIFAQTRLGNTYCSTHCRDNAGYHRRRAAVAQAELTPRPRAGNYE